MADAVSEMPIDVADLLSPADGAQAVAASGAARGVEVGKEEKRQDGEGEQEGSPRQVGAEQAQSLQKSAPLEVLGDGQLFLLA